MAASDAKPIPEKNVAYRITFPILDADGDLVTGATGLDSERSLDGATFADCTNEATEIATSSGMYFLDLTASEMNADTVAVIVKTSSSGAKTTPIVLYPEEAGDIRVNVTQLGSDAQSVTDLKDFADAGYDPATNKVQGVVLVDTTTTNTDMITAAAVNAECDTALADYDPPTHAEIQAETAIVIAAVIAKMLNYFQLMARSDAAIATDNATELNQINANEGSGAGNFDNTTDAQEALRDKQTDIEADTQDLQTQIGTAGAGLTAVVWNAAWDAEVQSECTDALNAYDPPTKAELDTAVGAVTLADGAHGGASATITLSDYSDFTGAAAANPNVLQSATITVTSQTEFTLSAGSADDDAYLNMVAVFEDASTAVQKSVRTITAYVGASKTVTIDSAPDFTIANTDNINILAVAPGSTPPTAAQIRTEIDDNSVEIAKIPKSDSTVSWNATALAAINAQADTALTDYDAPTKAELDAAVAPLALEATLATVDGIVDAILVDTGTTLPATLAALNNLSAAAVNAEVDTAMADYDAPTKAELDSAVAPLALEATLATVDGIVDSILVDTGTTLPATLATIAGYLDTEIAAILVDTGTTIPGLIAALNNLAAADVLAQSLGVESYAADGAVPTLAQALFALISMTGEFSIAGTTITCKKLDGSTTAMTFTLDDSTSPTSRTRAT